ncbi:hypothetical protein KEM52_003937, partial [Ascosphaera acerosa]
SESGALSVSEAEDVARAVPLGGGAGQAVSASLQTALPAGVAQQFPIAELEGVSERQRQGMRRGWQEVKVEVEAEAKEEPKADGGSDSDDDVASRVRRLMRVPLHQEAASDETATAMATEGGRVGVEPSQLAETEGSAAGVDSRDEGQTALAGQSDVLPHAQELEHTPRSGRVARQAGASTGGADIAPPPSPALTAAQTQSQAPTRQGRDSASGHGSDPASAAASTVRDGQQAGEEPPASQTSTTPATDETPAGADTPTRAPGSVISAPDSAVSAESVGSGRTEASLLETTLVAPLSPVALTTSASASAGSTTPAAPTQPATPSAAPPRATGLAPRPDIEGASAPGPDSAAASSSGSHDDEEYDHL